VAARLHAGWRQVAAGLGEGLAQKGVVRQVVDQVVTQIVSEVAADDRVAVDVPVVQALLVDGVLDGDAFVACVAALVHGSALSAPSRGSPTCGPLPTR